MKTNIEVEIDLAELSECLDLAKLSECIDLEDLASKVEGSVAENIDLDALAEKVAENIDAGDVAAHIGESIETRDIVEYIDLDYEQIVDGLDKNDIADRMIEVLLSGREDSPLVEHLAKHMAKANMVTPAAAVVPDVPVVPVAPVAPPAPGLTEDDVRRILREEIAAMVTRLLTK